ncbi:hypothetical protein ANAEL_04983 [Anaerolineales bacterium]|nr:hypothetical protein ANAEL_04983 [Anaerolineales bacterium]
MPPTQVPPYLEPQWFFPLFVAGWLAVSALLSRMSGWKSLAERFPDVPQNDGQRFRFASASMGASRWFPVNYSSCLFIHVGSQGLSLSVLLPFRFQSPNMLIPWSHVQSIEEQRNFFGTRTVIAFTGSDVTLKILGRAGKAVAAAFAASRGVDAL